MDRREKEAKADKIRSNRMKVSSLLKYAAPMTGVSRMSIEHRRLHAFIGCYPRDSHGLNNQNVLPLAGYVLVGKNGETHARKSLRLIRR